MASFTSRPNSSRGRPSGRRSPSGSRPSLEAIVATARQLASALGSAHAKGITHRDLKPENVMRTLDGRIKILDFGLARVAAPSDAPPALTVVGPGAVAGTPAYMAPEQIEAREVGPPADVFAFGVLMYEWISGRHPFEAGTVLATLARVIESKPEPLAARASVPAWLSEVIDRCLRKPAAERFGSGSELLQAFDHPAIASGPGPDQEHVVAYASGRCHRALHDRDRPRVAHQGMAARARFRSGCSS